MTRLEDRVGLSEDTELHLLVLFAGVSLRRDFAQLHLEFGERFARTFDPLGQRLAAHLREVRLARRLFAARADVEHALLRLLDRARKVSAPRLEAVECAL